MHRSSQISRRRMLQISAAACGSALLSSTGYAAGDRLKPVSWRGIALGSPAKIRLYSAHSDKGREILRRAVTELRRLEAIFSLYKNKSAISRLNRIGELHNPPPDLIRLLSSARGISVATGGAFDPTIQPLWALYADHFARQPERDQGPSARHIAGVLELVDYNAVTFDPHRIAFNRLGMGLSLNGIAQGYITDRIADLLRREGLNHVLVDLGETRGLGSHPSGRPWRVGIGTPGGKGEIICKVELIDKAIATSAPLGTPFEPVGKFHHLLDPRSGQCASLYKSVTVTAPNATLADAFSTAFAVMAWRDVRDSVREIGGLRVNALDAQGAWLETYA